MSPHKFIQVADTKFGIIALDSAGLVWWYKGETKSWMEMPSARVPIPDYDAPSEPASSTGD